MQELASTVFGDEAPVAVNIQCERIVGNSGQMTMSGTLQVETKHESGFVNDREIEIYPRATYCPGLVTLQNP